MESQGSRLGQGQRAEILHQLRQHLDLFHGGREMGLVGGVDTVDHRFKFASQNRQGRAQLVAHVGQECAALSLVLFEAGGHGVERLHERPQLSRAGVIFGDARRVVPRLHASGRLDQIAERESDSPCAEGYAGQQGDESEDHRGGQDPVCRARQPYRREQLSDDDERSRNDEGENQEGADCEPDEEEAPHPYRRSGDARARNGAR